MSYNTVGVKPDSDLTDFALLWVPNGTRSVKIYKIGQQEINSLQTLGVHCDILGWLSSHAEDHGLAIPATNPIVRGLCDKDMDSCPTVL